MSALGQKGTLAGEACLGNFDGLAEPWQLHIEWTVFTSMTFGRKMAEVIAHEGARLAVADLDGAGLQETARLCTEAGGKAQTHVAGCQTRPQWRRFLPTCTRILVASMASSTTVSTAMLGYLHRPFGQPKPQGEGGETAVRPGAV